MKRFGIYTLDSLDIAGKTVLLRVDINEPIDHEKDEVTDDTRIRGCVPTISELRDRGAKVVVLAHQGSDIEYKNFYTLRPHVKVLAALLKVNFCPIFAARRRRRQFAACRQARHCAGQCTLYARGADAI